MTTPTAAEGEFLGPRLPCTHATPRRRWCSAGRWPTAKLWHGLVCAIALTVVALPTALAADAPAAAQVSEPTAEATAGPTTEPAAEVETVPEMSDAEAIAFLLLLALFPLSVLAIRWLTQRHILRLMNSDSTESDEAGPAVSDAQGVRSAVAPRFALFDKAHGLAGAVQARERFVAHSLSLFRRFVMLDVVAGLVYVALLYTLGSVSITEDKEELAWALVLVGSVYPLLAGLRYLFYRRQFRPLDAHFRRGWWSYVPVFTLLRALRVLLGPKFQAVTAGIWVALMALMGIGLAFDETDGPTFRAVAALLAVVAVAQPLVVWHILTRMRRETGVSLLVLRVFGIDANASFTFGRLLAFWQHFGNHFTVLDPSIWRLRYPLMSWRTGGFMLGVALAGLLALAVVMQNPAWEPVAFMVTAPVLLVLLTLYAVVSRLRLAREFIRSRGQLVQVLDRLAERPRNVDLSFRHLEAMCHNNTWKIAVEEFARRSQVLLMDLRGFCNERKGCQYEVDFLLDAVPLERVVFLVQDGGDHDAVRQLILDRWAFLSPDSPNLGHTEPVACLYVSTVADEADVQAILDLLIQAAQHTAGPAPRAAAAPLS